MVHPYPPGNFWDFQLPILEPYFATYLNFHELKKYSKKEGSKKISPKIFETFDTLVINKGGILMLIALILACQDYSITEQKQGEPIIAPDFIDFGHLESGVQTDTKQIIFSNGSENKFIVQRLEIFGERFLADTQSFEVEPGSWHALDVTYDPETFEFNEGFIDVYLEGVDEPHGSVWLQGWGDAPLLVVEPLETDFGVVSQGCSTSSEISLLNDGNLDLTITSLSQLGTIPQEMTLNFGTLPTLPWTLSPGARISFWADFLALTVASHSLDVQVASNDPQSPLKRFLVKGEAMTSERLTDSFIQGTNIYVDIIWVIDNSGSMSWAQALLASNIMSFVNMFMSFGPDFQMAFITTDNPFFRDNITLTQSTQNIASIAGGLVTNIGNRGSANEMGLEMLRQSHMINIQWFRPGAHFVAIFLSDEPDASPGSVANYINYFDSYYPQGMFLPYAIIGDVPWGCTDAWAGLGYWDLTMAYNTNWWSICSVDWGSQLQDIATSIASASSFVLNHPSPKENTIEVRVNGQLQQNNWTYNSNLNSIIFDFGSMPQQGDWVEISYEIWEC